MANFCGNFKGGRPPQQCPVCKEAESVDTQMHSFQCKVMADELTISGRYQEIFTPNIDVHVARTVTNIEEFREEKLRKYTNGHNTKRNKKENDSKRADR